MVVAAGRRVAAAGASRGSQSASERAVHCREVRSSASAVDLFVVSRGAAKCGSGDSSFVVQYRRPGRHRGGSVLPAPGALLRRPVCERTSTTRTIRRALFIGAGCVTSSSPSGSHRRLALPCKMPTSAPVSPYIGCRQRGRSRIAPLEFAQLALRIGPVAAVLGLMLRHRLTASFAQLSTFSRARLALLGYENLFPRVMAAALQARGIVVAAAQERFVQPFHPGFHLVLDHYLVHGERSAAVVRANPLCQVGSIAITGDLRQPRRKAGRQSGAHRCLVLDYHSVHSPFDDAFAIGNSWASNRLFLEDVLRLSEDFPEVQFTIRGKDTSWTDLPAFADLASHVGRARPNLTVDRDRSLDRSYVLLADSDSVVARHTSLGDQALALGMPVLFYERMATG